MPLFASVMNIALGDMLSFDQITLLGLICIKSLKDDIRVHDGYLMMNIL